MPEPISLLGMMHVCTPGDPVPEVADPEAAAETMAALAEGGGAALGLPAPAGAEGAGGAGGGTGASGEGAGGAAAAPGGAAAPAGDAGAAAAPPPLPKLVSVSGRGGPVVVPGQSRVFVDGVPMAVVGGLCQCPCTSSGDVLMPGSSIVHIDGLPVVRLGDPTALGGEMAEGVPHIVAD